EEIGRFNRTVSSWWNFNARYKYASLLTMTAACLGVILLVYSLGRRLFRRMIFRDPSVEQPTYLARLSTGIWLVLITTVSIIVFVLVSLIAFSASGLLNEKMLSLFEGSFSLILIVMLVKALTDAILSPKNTAWSLLPIAAAPARRIQWLIIGIAFFAGLDFWLNAISEQLDSPVSVSVLKAIFATVVVGILITLLGRVKPFRDEDGNATAWPAWFRYTLFALGIIPIAAVGLGYVGFARFVLEQIVVTGAVLVTMYLGFQSSHALSQEDAFAKTSLGKRLAGTGRFDDATLDQLSIAFGLLVNFLVVLIGIPLVLMQWGFQLQDILHWGYRLATEIRIGSVSFSLVGVLTGILVFIIAYFATRWFQGWLDNSVLKRGRFDSGVRNSIRTAVGYLGIAIAILIGISVAGIDLSNLALVAGALSLGIGFGLQNIVSNFVSGLILLAERPFKVGDWIEAGGHMGLVKRISVRATEIETFQRQTIILPNSELINSAVGNRTHRNHLGRVDIAVGVSYDCDPAFVRDLLLDIARENKLVLRNPEPQVFFANFGASSLDFELRVHVADIFTTAVVQTELRIEIFRQLKAAGIEIPFPQQDIHIKSGAPEDVRRFVDRMRPEGSDVKSDGEGEAATPAEPEPAAKPARRRNPRKAE
ncbi:MAG: mechanosensitive ion channel family protein, partial [Notoacmeibacter sp.]|nr:mechanosensitive ion channel family protein [Notoacmeibacter sp.]